MKHTFLSGLLTALLIVFAVKTNTAQQKTTSQLKDVVTFYQVPMVCPASPNIGCGSRAKPVLLSLEKSPDVKEAWLNRTGTVLAVVWNRAEKTRSVVKPVFDKYEVSYTVVNPDQKLSYLRTFRQTGKWYHAAEVDQLSLEEARNVSQSFVRCLAAKKYISQKESEGIRSDIEKYFNTELVKLKTYQELQASEEKFRQDIIALVQRRIGKERVQSLMDKIKQAGGYQAFCE